MTVDFHGSGPVNSMELFTLQLVGTDPVDPLANWAAQGGNSLGPSYTVPTGPDRSRPVTTGVTFFKVWDGGFVDTSFSLGWLYNQHRVWSCDR
jgi:hypothetical protein